MHKLAIAFLAVSLPSLALGVEPQPKAPELAIDAYRLPNGNTLIGGGTYVSASSGP